MRSSEDPNQKIVVNSTEARQSSNVKGMPLVLGLSTIGAFALCFLIYLAFFG